MGKPDGQGERGAARGKWLALTAALLGWMFDGLEMGLFPLVGRPALRDLMGGSEAEVGRWMGVTTATFLVGAATGGVLFGWLGDRLGRVRAMTLSVLTYSLFSGLCGLATAPWQIAGLRFVSALGMGGEWALGVALVMEIWPDQSRAVLAGLIGAAANLGYLLIAVLGLWLNALLPEIRSALLTVGLPDDWIEALLRNSGWRLLLILGALPALLTFFIRLFVPESERWRHEQRRGSTSHWAARDLLGVGVGAIAACLMIYLWAVDLSLWVRIPGSLLALVVVTLGYTYPVWRYLERSSAVAAGEGGPAVDRRRTLTRMFLGACLGGVALLGTWASIQWAPFWADKLVEGTNPDAKGWTQFWSAAGAVVGCVLGALLAGWGGRRLAYSVLCAGSLAASLFFFRMNTEYGPQFLISVFVAGGFTAAFYGWLPLYLPELFPTRVRATGQGFSYNFGRILAAVGTLQTGTLMALLAGDNPRSGGYPEACSIMSLIYLVGLVIIWLAPETHGKPLPE
jgi:MFS transporter, SHS family, sialic acid transporter